MQPSAGLEWAQNFGSSQSTEYQHLVDFQAPLYPHLNDFPTEWTNYNYMNSPDLNMPLPYHSTTSYSGQNGLNGEQFNLRPNCSTATLERNGRVDKKQVSCAMEDEEAIMSMNDDLISLDWVRKRKD